MAAENEYYDYDNEMRHSGSGKFTSLFTETNEI